MGKAAERKEELINEHQKKEVTFNDFCEQYISWARIEKPGSAITEERRLNKIKDFFRSKNLIYLSDITPYHIEELKAALKSGEIPTKGREEEKKLSKRTINFYLQLLGRIFYKAIDWEIYTKQNPLKKVRFLKPDSRKEALSKQQVEMILKASREVSNKSRSQLQKVFHDLVVLALNTGMRRSEILYLRWKDVGENVLTVKGKGGKIRSIPINSEAKRILGKQPRKTEFVFDIPNRSSKESFSRVVKKIRKISGVHNWHFHLLRHFFATSLIEKGVDFITVKEILGHSSLTMSEIYTHTDEEKKRKAVETKDMGLEAR